MASAACARPDRRRRRGGFLALVVLLSASAPRADAWGFTAHRLVNRKSIATLPDTLRPLFQANADYVAEHSIDADLRRLTPNDPDHFLDMDFFGAPPFDAIPRREAEHLAKHGPAARDKGRIPWRVDDVYRELVAAFAAREPARILERAAELGHFVGDAHVPLHAALNYDGQLSGQAGLHNRWESELVERFERQLEAGLLPAPARRVADPVSLSFEVLATSYADSLEVLASDRASAGPADFIDTPEDDRYDDAYYSKLYEREGGRLLARLAQSVTTLGSLWLSAWEDAGRPPLDASFRFPYVRKQSKAVVVSLDGAAAPLVDAAVERGVMPHLARLRAAGAVAKGSIPALPCKTAASHAALYTGAWSDRNGIGGNDLAVPGGSILEQQSGYASTHLAAEPLWATAARQGLEATVVSATQVYPFEPFLGGKRFDRNYGWRVTLFDGYENSEAEPAIYTAAALGLRPATGWIGTLPGHDGEARELAFEVGGTAVGGLLYDDPEDSTVGFDTLYLGSDKRATGGVTLKPLPPRGAGDASAFGRLRVELPAGVTALYFRLFALSADGTRILLYRSAPHLLRSSRPGVDAAALEAAGGFVGNGADRLYEQGALGPPLWEGGDGSAELRYLETVSLVVRQFTRLTELGIERTRWDVLFTYLPYPDEALHLWYGRLDPKLPGYDPVLAARLRPLLDQVLSLCDGFLARIAERGGEHSILAVVADHGQVATDRLVRPNAALAAAGLLALDAGGHVDVSGTRALYTSGGFVLINRAARPGGIVLPAQEAAVRSAVARALTGIRDPQTGAAVVQDVLDPRRPGADPRFGGPTGGDLYLSLSSRYRVSSSLRGDVVEPAAPKGDHFSNPERREMQAAFALVGPGVAAGVDLGVVRQIDVAPTLCALLGIDPPAHATGEVLKRALGRH